MSDFLNYQLEFQKYLQTTATKNALHLHSKYSYFSFLKVLIILENYTLNLYVVTRV